MEFKEGDAIEIIENDGYFYPTVQVGDQGVIKTVSGNQIQIWIPDRGIHQTTTRRKNNIKLVKREIKVSGFAKFVRSIEDRHSSQSDVKKIDSLAT